LNIRPVSECVPKRDRRVQLPPNEHSHITVGPVLKEGAIADGEGEESEIVLVGFLKPSEKGS
jgi:hypothetical protein